MKREDIIREIQTMMPAGQDGYQIAKSVFKLSEKPAGTAQKIGKSGRKRLMTQAQAARVVAGAIARIKLADAPD